MQLAIFLCSAWIPNLLHNYIIRTPIKKKTYLITILLDKNFAPSTSRINQQHNAWLCSVKCYISNVCIYQGHGTDRKLECVINKLLLCINAKPSPSPEFVYKWSDLLTLGSDNVKCVNVVIFPCRPQYVFRNCSTELARTLCQLILTLRQLSCVVLVIQFRTQSSTKFILFTSR